MLTLDIERDDDLDAATEILYFIATADILPDFLLIPFREFFFGQFDEEDDLVPEYFEMLGYDSRNFIMCIGSCVIFLTLITITLVLNELILTLLVLNCLCRFQYFI